MSNRQLWEVKLLAVIWLCAILDCGSGHRTAQLEDEAPFRIEYLNNNPGIYYEPLRDLQLVRKEWQIITTIDLVSLHRQISKIATPHHNMMLEKCTSILDKGECEEILKVKSIESIRVQIVQLNLHLDDLFKAPETKPVDFRGRRTPPLAIVGSIHRSLFGLMDYNDYKHITKEIDRLYQTQKEITSITNNSTHILRSKIEDVNHLLNNTNSNIITLKRTAEEFLNRINAEDHHLRKLEYKLSLMRAGTEAESSYSKMLEVTKNLVDAVDAAKHGRITHTLLTPKQLHDVAESIKSIHPELEFPIPTGATDYAALSMVSTINVAHASGKLLAIITLPLLGKDEYHLYRLHPCKRSQLVGNRTLSAHITPTKPYIIIAEDRRHYALLDQIQLDKCAPIGSRIACTPNFPISNAMTKPICEVMLILNPSVSVLRTCDVKITRIRGVEWELLEPGNRWLFTTNEPERGEVICPKGSVTKVDINGTGVITLSPGCRLQTDRDLITHIGILETTELKIHLPSVNLTLLDLAPDLAKDPAGTDALISMHIDPLPNQNDHSRTEMQLNEAQRRLDEIGRMHQETYHHRLITFGSIGGLSLLTLGGIAFYLFRTKVFWNLLKRMHKCFKSKKEEKVVVPTPKARKTRSSSLPTNRPPHCTSEIYAEVHHDNTAEDSRGRSYAIDTTRPVTLIANDY